MRVGRAIAGSLAAHVGGLAIFVHSLAATRTSAVVWPIVPRMVVPPSREPIAVVIFDARETASREGTASEPLGHGAVTTSQGAGAREPGSAVPDRSVGSHSDLMTMRRPELGLSAATLEAIAGHGELPSPVQISGRLRNQPGGGAVVNDAVATVTVARDGTAHLESKPDIDIHLTLPVLPDIRKDLRDVGEGLRDWYADPYAGERYNRTIDLPEHLQAVPGQCDTWGDGMCDDPLAPEARFMKNELSNDDTTTPVIAGGRLDLTSYLSKKFHAGDVYASRKLKLLDDTRAERIARGTEFRADQLARSAELMRRNLDKLGSLDGPALHEALFELWDECAEGDTPTGQAGERARAQVIGWIGAHLPARAFTDEEIKALDGRRSSTQHFAPYPPH